MQLIASDSFDVEPKTVDAIYSNPGERFDFVLNANQTGGELSIQRNSLLNSESFQTVLLLE